MRKKLILLSLLVFVGGLVTAYAQEETVVVKKSSLTTEQIKMLEQEQSLTETKETVEKYSEIVGIGKEIGIAINDGLTAVVGASEKFGKTDVGKFTMLIIGWKFLYKDIISIIIGMLLLILVNIIIFKSYRNLCTHKVKKIGAWYQFWVTKEYEIVEGAEWEGVEFVKLLLIGFVALSFVIAYSFMF